VKLKPKILTRFLIRRFLAGVGMVMLIVCGIIFAITFVERLPSNPTAGAALLDAWIRLMEYTPMFLPLAVFMGTLLMSYNMTKSSEMVMVSAAGQSPYQASYPFLGAAAAIGILATALLNPYSVGLSNKYLSDNNFSLVGGAIWLRDNTDEGWTTLSAKTMRPSDDMLEFRDATIYRQGQDFKLTQRIEAKKVVLSDAGLNAKSAKIWNKEGKDKTGEWHAKTALNPKIVLDRYLKPSQISFWRLPGFIIKLNDMGISPRGHLVQLWTLVLLPLTMMAMAALGVAFSQTHERRNFNFGFKFGIGILTCFALYFVSNVMGALGATGALPALIAVLAPPVIIIAAAGAAIATFDVI
jgi:lipopolysaccharide export system permease protein